MSQSPKRKKGQPSRKEVADSTMSQSPKRKRGQPSRKEVADSTMSQSPKRKRGQPSRKEVADSTMKSGELFASETYSFFYLLQKLFMNRKMFFDLFSLVL
jgi:hypothetical protein